MFEPTKPNKGCVYLILAGFVGMLAGLYQLAQALT